jgi:uncharacterized membrane protein
VKLTNWFIAIVLYTVLTLVCAHFIPTGSVFSFFSYFFGFTFVAFMPGYCLLSFLFSEGKLDLIEQTVLSVALSFSIAGVSGLFLGLSPIGINVYSITISLSGIVVILALLAFMRKTGRLAHLRVRKLKSVSRV